MRNSCLTGNFLIPEVPLNAYNFHFYSNHWCMLIVDQLSWWYKNMFAPESQIFRCLMAKVQIQFCWRQLRKCPMMPPPPRPHLQLEPRPRHLQLLHHPPPHPRRRQPTPPCTQGRLPSCAWDRWCNWMISRHISTGQFILGKLPLASHSSTQSTWAAWSLEALQPGSTNFRQNSVNWDIWQGDPQTTRSWQGWEANLLSRHEGLETDGAGGLLVLLLHQQLVHQVHPSLQGLQEVKIT